MSGPTPPWLRSLIIQYLGILNSLAHLGPAVQDFFPKRRNAPVHCDIHFRPWKNQLRLQQTQRRCGEMADATDLKYAAMPRSNRPLPSYCHFLNGPARCSGSRLKSSFDCRSLASRLRSIDDSCTLYDLRRCVIESRHEYRIRNHLDLLVADSGMISCSPSKRTPTMREPRLTTGSFEPFGIRIFFTPCETSTSRASMTYSSAGD